MLLYTVKYNDSAAWKTEHIENIYGNMKLTNFFIFLVLKALFCENMRRKNRNYHLSFFQQRIFKLSLSFFTYDVTYLSKFLIYINNFYCFRTPETGG